MYGKGFVPVKRFAPKLIERNETRVEISEGILPENELKLKSIKNKEVRDPIKVGSGPPKRLLFK